MMPPNASTGVSMMRGPHQHRSYKGRLCRRRIRAGHMLPISAPVSHTPVEVPVCRSKASIPPSAALSKALWPFYGSVPCRRPIRLCCSELAARTSAHMSGGQTLPCTHAYS